MVWERFGNEYLKSTKITCLIPQYFVKPSICLQIGKYVIIKKSIYISTGSVLNFYGSYQRKEISMLLSQIKQQRGFFLQDMRR